MQLTEQDKTAIMLKYGPIVLSVVPYIIQHRSQLLSADIHERMEAVRGANEILEGTQSVVITNPDRATIVILTFPEYTFVNVAEILAMVTHE